ncbi:MAG: exodeoxyribonuclease III [Rikenellaceae bacterium]
MKIISWNVNGLRSCIDKGFFEIVTRTNADIYCFQETKATQSQVGLSMPGYTQFWNSARRQGYSGVLVLTKVEPLSVREGFGIEEFDIEGRLLTLEYQEFILLCVYMPMSKGRLRRSSYRSEWDDALLTYVQSLHKPVIICGDFNVAHHYIDIYPENLRNSPNPAGFQELERTNFDRLLQTGFIDIFRQRNPKKQAYTWWSNRLNKRSENRGWRLDYFLVGADLIDYTIDTNILGEIQGSDHCPISLDIDLALQSEHSAQNEQFTRQWESTDWSVHEEYLRQKQIKIAKATYNRNGARIHTLQMELVNAFSARMLAVRHVANSSSETGMDGVKWTTSAQKMRAVYALNFSYYQCAPLRSVIIHDGKKERRINIPTYYDRAMQTLVRYALEPVAESSADRKSFGFRKGRSSFDANSYILSTMSKTKAPLWVFRGDIKSYYDTISHQWILENIPMRNLLQKFLKTGMLINGELFEIDAGISQGSGLSPIIGNMVLDGLQQYIFCHLYPDGIISNYTHGDLIRFADDFLVFARDEEQANKIKAIVANFLAERGLRISEEKSGIYMTTKGFSFLGRQYLMQHGVAYAFPSEKSVEAFEHKLEEKIMRYDGSIESLIKSVNRSIHGYASYHRITDARDTFRHLDVVVQGLLAKKVRSMHPKRAWVQLQNMYWYENERGEHIFTAPEKRHLQVIRFRDISPALHYAVKTNFNSFLDGAYYQEIEKRREIDKHRGKYKRIWNSQAGRCYYCGRPMLSDQYIELAETFTSEGVVYIHTKCAGNSIEHDEDFLQNKSLDTLELLDAITATSNTATVDVTPLKEHFRMERRQKFTITFDEFEYFLGDALDAESCTEAYWYDSHPTALSRCWLDNGFIIQTLDMKNERVIFRKEDHTLTAFEVPKVFYKKKIPKNAQDEIEEFLKYIAQKYKL